MVYSIGFLHSKPQWLNPFGEHGSHMGTWEQKEKCQKQAPTYNIMNWWEAKLLKRNTHLRRIHGIIGICLKTHLVLRLLLQGHSKKTNIEHLIVSLGINSGGRTTSCWPDATKPKEFGAIAIVVVMGAALEQTTVTDVVVVVAVNWNNEKHYKEKHSLHKFPRLKIGYFLKKQ